VKIGKISNQDLKDAIFSKIKLKRKDVLIGPEVGRDCSIIDFGEELCVVSSDPITGAAHQIGYLGVHISCNDIATTGAEPIGIMLTLLAPPSASLTDIEQVMIDTNRAAEEIGVDILGGHTETTTAVERMVLSITAIGRVKKDLLVQPEKARPGDHIILTKKAGMEGTAILAYEKEECLKEGRIPADVIQRAQGFLKQISVIKEGAIAARLGAHGMHDATEGGVLGACWEIAQVMGKGVEIYKELIPVAPETEQICDFFGVNPLRLISSGCMVIVAPNGDELIRSLRLAGIEAVRIGTVLAENQSWLIEEGKKLPLSPPDADELYSVVG